MIIGQKYVVFRTGFGQGFTAPDDAAAITEAKRLLRESKALKLALYRVAEAGKLELIQEFRRTD